MKKSTLLISSLVLSTVLAFGQANRKASPIVKHNHINQTSNDNSNVEQRYANLPKTPSGHIRCITPEYHEGEEQFESWISEKIKEISSANNLSAKAVILKDHCNIGFRSTGKPPRSLTPSFTSSFAKTVPNSSHQFT